MATTIVTKSGSGAPTASNLVAGELAVDLTNKRLYTENSSGTVLELGTNPASDVTFGDNTKAVFGDGSDLRIYHTGSHSTIENIGTGHLQIHTTDFRLKDSAGTESMILANADGNVQLYYDNALKLATTATGIDVTGTVTADGLTVQTTGSTTAVLTLNNADGNGTLSQINLGYTADPDHGNIQYTGDMIFTAAAAERMRIDSSGNVGIGTATTNAVRLTATTATANHVGLIVENSNAADSFGMVVKAGNDANDYTADFRKRDNTTIMRIRGDGNVGIGQSIPKTVLNASASTGAILTLESSDTTLTTNDVIGGINFYANDSSTNGTGAKVNIKAIATSTAGTVTALTFGTSDSASATAVEAMRIDASGNVGIGTTSVSDKLQILGGGSSNTTGITLTNNNGTDNIGNSITFRGSYGAPFSTDNIYARISGLITSYNGSKTGNLVFSTGSNNSISERMRIDASGNLLVGSTDADAGISGTPTNPPRFSFKVGNGEGIRSSTTGSHYWNTLNDSSVHNFRRNGADVGSISVSTGATAYNTSSDQRLKENIADADDAGSKIDAIQVRKFDWKVDGSHQDYGMVAQELQVVAPEAVHQPADSEEMMGVDYSKLVPIMLKEIQSLRARVAQLES